MRSASSQRQSEWKDSKKKKIDGAFRLFSLVWAMGISFWNMGQPCHFHLPFLAALHIFTHFPLVLLPKSVLFSLEIPWEILTNVHKGGPWMTLHSHRPRTRQCDDIEKVLDIPLMLGWKTSNGNFCKDVYIYLFFFFLQFFNNLHILENTNAVILLYILSKLNELILKWKRRNSLESQRAELDLDFISWSTLCLRQDLESLYRQVRVPEVHLCLKVNWWDFNSH